MFMSITGNELNSVTKYPGFMRVGSSLAVNAAEDEYYTFNGHGDVNSIVDINDNVLKLYDYDAFGNERVDNGEDTNPYRYCGEYYDVETGNIYLRARYYDPSIGRFISEDPIRDGLNWYSYCDGNPVNFIDPSGKIREGFTDEKGVYHADPDAEEFGKDSNTYKALVDLGNRWADSVDSKDRMMYSNLANKIREFAREGTPIKYGQDIIIDTLHSNVEMAIEFQNSLLKNPFYDKSYFFIDSVSFLIGQVNKGPWDYKYIEEWQVDQSYEIFDGTYMSSENARNYKEWIYFDGQLIGADKVGNMNMAYVGYKMGLPEYVYKNFTTTDKDDALWVQYGIEMAKSGR